MQGFKLFTRPFQEVCSPGFQHRPRVMKVQCSRFVSFCVMPFFKCWLEVPMSHPQVPSRSGQTKLCFEFLHTSMHVHVMNFVFASFLVCCSSGEAEQPANDKGQCHQGPLSEDDGGLPLLCSAWSFVPFWPSLRTLLGLCGLS